MKGDWISLHRKLLKNPIMNHDGLFRLWIYCLMRANWKDKTWIIPGTHKTINVPRGSFITGRESLFEEMYPTVDSEGQPIRREYTPVSRTLWRWLVLLSNLECLKLETVSNRCTMVTICNYNTYQQQDDEPCPAGRPARVPHDDIHVSTTKQINNSNKVKQGGAADAATSGEDSEKSIRAEEVPIPEILDTPDFRRVRDEWFAQRRSRRLSLRSKYVARQYELLLPLGPQRAIACIQYTLDSDYQALLFDRFSEKTNGNHGNRSGRPRQTNTGTPAGTAGRGDI